MVALIRGVCAAVFVSAVILPLPTSWGQATEDPLPEDASPDEATPDDASPDDASPDDGFPEHELYRVLTAGREDEKLAALVRLDTYGEDPRAADLLVKVIEKKDTDSAVPESTLRMIMMLVRFPEHAGAREMLVELLESENWKIVIVAVDALGEIGDAAVLEEIARLVESPHYPKIYGFRKSVLQAVMEIRDPGAVAFVIEQLPNLTGQLLYDAVRYLSHASVQRFGGKGDVWATWWEDNAEDFRFASDEPFSPVAEVTAEELSFEVEAPEFFGIYIYAKRLVFVLDVSSSMTAATMAGQTRIALAKQELVQAVGKLPEDTYFNILAFDADVVRWKSRMVPATKDNRENAAAWVLQIAPGKGTASFDALERAFAVDGNTEAIFFLSDGKPSKGKVTDPAAIVQIITAENFFRRIALYTFGFPEAGQQFMKSLAELNNGQYKPIQ
ncbi:MAG TPA: HEAT repeat domain-containing protein [Thermoguttaceae bacterium]|nr:HEAT repeat domain-containing protein [Thermoguttaceae bacterium]